MDVVAAAAQGKHCVVQIVRVRDGTVAAIPAATAGTARRASAADASPDDAETFIRRTRRADVATGRQRGV